MSSIDTGLAKLDRTTEARQELIRARRLSLDVNEKAVLEATEGLIYFRENQFALGSIKYKNAIDYFASKGAVLHQAFKRYDEWNVTGWRMLSF